MGKIQPNLLKLKDMRMYIKLHHLLSLLDGEQFGGDAMVMFYNRPLQLVPNSSRCMGQGNSRYSIYIEKFIVTQLLKNFRFFYGNQKFIISFPKAPHSTLP
jgi:hypothetical protein